MNLGITALPPSVLSASPLWCQLAVSWQYNNKRLKTRATQAQLLQMVSVLMPYLSVEVLRWLWQLVSSEAPWEAGVLSRGMIGSLFPYFSIANLQCLSVTLSQLLVLYNIIHKAFFSFPLKWKEIDCNKAGSSLSKWTITRRVLLVLWSLCPLNCKCFIF